MNRSQRGCTWSRILGQQLEFNTGKVVAETVGVKTEDIKSLMIVKQWTQGQTYKEEHNPMEWQVREGTGSGQRMNAVF